MDTFNTSWVPNHDMSVEASIDDDVKVITLGKGAVQLQKQTLGPTPEVYTLTFSGSVETVKEIRDWLKARSGQRFIWTPPLEAGQIIVYCSKRSQTPLGEGMENKLSVTFTEVPY